MTGYGGPILPFVDESPSFVLGFEAGRIYQSLQADVETQTFTVHGANVELMMRIAEQAERDLKWEEFDDPTWSVVTFGPAEV